MSDTADAASSSTKCPKFEPLDFDNSFKELRSYCLGGRPLCLVATLPDPVTMFVHQRSAAVKVLAAAGALAHAAYQMAPGAAQDTAIENLIRSDPVSNMRTFVRAICFAAAGGGLGNAAVRKSLQDDCDEWLESEARVYSACTKYLKGHAHVAEAPLGAGREFLLQIQGSQGAFTIETTESLEDVWVNIRLGANEPIQHYYTRLNAIVSKLAQAQPVAIIKTAPEIKLATTTPGE